MAHEKSLLEKITSLRVEAMQPNLSEAQQIKLDAQLTKTLGSFMVAVENYPDLKANQNILHLQQTLVEIEEQISAARRAYNQAVTDYNNALEQIPTNFIASFLHYLPKEVFEIPQEQRNNVNLKELFQTQ
jgi:LemA protein